jgi:type II secretion system protein D
MFSKMRIVEKMNCNFGFPFCQRAAAVAGLLMAQASLMGTASAQSLDDFDAFLSPVVDSAAEMKKIQTLRVLSATQRAAAGNTRMGDRGAVPTSLTSAAPTPDSDSQSRGGRSFSASGAPARVPSYGARVISAASASGGVTTNDAGPNSTDGRLFPLLAQADAAAPANQTTPPAGGPPGGARPGPGPGPGTPGAAVPPTAQGADGNSGISGDRVTLQFPLNPVSDLLTIYERLIEKTIVKDTSVFNGAQVSLVTPGDVSKAEAIRLIEMTLVTNGYVIVAEPGEEAIKILLGRPGNQSQESSFSEGMEIYSDPQALPGGESLVGYFMELEHIAPEDAATIFGNHVVLNEFGRITPVATPQGLLITESSSIVRQLIRLKAIIDAPTESAMLMTTFVKLEYAEANVVAQIIQAAMDARAEEALRLSETGTTITGERPTQQQQQQQQQQQRTPTQSRSNQQPDPNAGQGIGTADQPAAQLIPDDRLNRVMVVATAPDVAYILELIEQFDQPSDNPTPLERALDHVKANDILPVIVDLLQDTGSGQTVLPGGRTIDSRATPVFSSQLASLTGSTTNNTQADTRTNATATDDTGRPDQLAFSTDDIAPVSVLIGKTRVIADRQANKIIVVGPKESQDVVIDIIDRLDVRPLQVYLATVIGQLTLGDDVEFGVDYLQKFTEFENGNPAEGGIASGLINNRDDIITNNNVADLRNNLVTTAFGPTSGLNVYGQIGESLDTFVSALESTNRFKVLSRPVVYTQNGKRAEITNGQRIPVPQQSLTDSTGQVNNAAVQTTIGFEDVVLKLEVLPTINEQHEVTLEIVQVNDTVIGTQIVANNNVPIIGTQELNTTVTVPDRSTIVLGGLITETDTTTTSGIPLLSRIPILGALARNTVDSIERTELIIFIQPIVVGSDGNVYLPSVDEDLRTAVGEHAAEVFPNPGVPTEKLEEDQAVEQAIKDRIEEKRKKRRFLGIFPRREKAEP